MRVERLRFVPHFLWGRKTATVMRHLVPAAVMFLVAALPAQAEDIAPEALNSLSTVHRISDRPVFDTKGGRIGSVASTTPRGDGMLWSVTIRLENGRQVNGLPANGVATQTILASQASFDGSRVIAEADGPRG
jgi:hypothetical protein